MKIVCVEKANIERSGAVAQGLYAINCYMGMHWNENQPEDHVRYARKRDGREAEGENQGGERGLSHL
jgi:succinate dehydrogenase/fumarate reductase flavoprotein subunit